MSSLRCSSWRCCSGACGAGHRGVDVSRNASDPLTHSIGRGVGPVQREVWRTREESNLVRAVLYHLNEHIDQLRIKAAALGVVAQDGHAIVKRQGGTIRAFAGQA